MPAGTTAYLVVRRDDGFGDVFPLAAGQTYTMGRAATNRIVLKDDLCSREHAEISFSGGRWRVRDLNSLNGIRVNSVRLEGQWELAPHDEIYLGRTRLLFVEDMNQLPDLPQQEQEPQSEGMAIRKRLGQTRFQTPQPLEPADDDATVPPARHALSRDLSLLYRLALDMGSVNTFDELCRVVLDALLEAVPAEVGAILSAPRDGHGRGAPPVGIRVAAGESAKTLRGLVMEVTAHRHRDASLHDYKPVSEYVSNEVLASREAILAEDVARDRY
ncbi:MAG: FHA domain-containing protein, partial [Gemmataceae bacterium]